MFDCFLEIYITHPACSTGHSLVNHFCSRESRAGFFSHPLAYIVCHRFVCWPVDGRPSILSISSRSAPNLRSLVCIYFSVSGLPFFSSSSSFAYSPPTLNALCLSTLSFSRFVSQLNCICESSAASRKHHVFFSHCFCCCCCCCMFAFYYL